jgi:hypothetical protein
MTVYRKFCKITPGLARCGGWEDMRPPHPLRLAEARDLCGAAAGASGHASRSVEIWRSALTRLRVSAWRSLEIVAGETFPRSFELLQFAEFCAHNLFFSGPPETPGGLIDTSPDGSLLHPFREPAQIDPGHGPPPTCICKMSRNSSMTRIRIT